MECRPYAAYAIYDMKRWWVFLVLPFLRPLLAVVAHRPVTVSVWEWCAAAVLLGYSVLKWRTCRYELSHTDNGRFHTVRIRQGILTRHALRICADDAASVEVECTPLLWILGGRRIRISTAGLKRRADAVLYLSATRTRRLFSPKRQGGTVVRSPWFPVLVMAVSGSNAAVGLLTAAPLLQRAGQLLGQEFPQTVLSAAQAAALRGLPAVLQGTAAVFVFGWAFAALRTLLRYVRFHAGRDGELLHLTSGLFTRRHVFIDRSKITALELRQTLAMRILGVYTAVITAAGYGRDAGARPVLVPAARPDTLCHQLDHLLPDYPVGAAPLAPSGRWRYVAWPLTWLGIACLAAGGGIWPPAAITAVVLAAWWLTVRLLGVQEAGFGVDHRSVTVCYPRGLALYRVHLPREVTDCITFTQTPFQKKRGTCTVEVRCYGEKRRRHRVWNVPCEAAKELLKIPLH